MLKMCCSRSNIFGRVLFLTTITNIEITRTNTSALISIMTFLVTIIVFDLTQVYLNFFVLFDANSIDPSSWDIDIRGMVLRFIVQIRIFFEATKTLIRLDSIFNSTSIITLVSSRKIIYRFSLLQNLISLWNSRFPVTNGLISNESCFSW